MKRLPIKTSGFSAGRKVFVKIDGETLLSEDSELPTGFLLGVEVPVEPGKYSAQTVAGALLIVVSSDSVLVELSPWHTTTGDRYDLDMSVANEPFKVTDRVAAKFYHGIVRTAFDGTELFSARWYFDTMQPIKFPNETIKEDYFKKINNWTLVTGYLTDNQSKVIIRGDTKLLLANNVIGIHKDTGDYIWGYDDWDNNGTPRFIRAYSSGEFMDFGVFPDGSILLGDIDQDCLLKLNPETGEVLGKLTSQEVEEKISEFFGEAPGWWDAWFSVATLNVVMNQQSGDFTLFETYNTPYGYSLSWKNNILSVKQVIEHSNHEPEFPELAWAEGLVWSDLGTKIEASSDWYYPRQYVQYKNFFIVTNRDGTPTLSIDFYNIEDGQLVYSIATPVGAEGCALDLNQDTLIIAYGSNTGYFLTIQEINLLSYSVSDTFTMNYPDFNEIKNQFTWDYSVDIYEGWDYMISYPRNPTSIRKLANQRYMIIVYDGFYSQAMVYGRVDNSFEDFRLVGYSGYMPGTASFNREEEIMVLNGSYGISLYDGKRYSNLPYFSWAITYPDSQHPSAFTDENTLTFYLRSNGGITCMSDLIFIDGPEEDFSTGRQGEALPEGWYTQSSEVFKPPKFESTEMFGYMSPGRVVPYGNGFISGQRKFLNGIWEGNFTEKDLLPVFNNGMNFCFYGFSKTDDNSAYMNERTYPLSISPGRLGDIVRKVSLDTYEELPMDITTTGLPTNGNDASLMIKIGGELYFFGVANRRTFRFREGTEDWEELAQIPTTIGSLTEANTRMNYRTSPFADYRNFIHNDEFYYTLATGTTVRKVIKYNTTSNTWSVVTDIPGTTDLISARIHFVYSGKIYYPVLGQIYDIGGNSWGAMDPIPVELSEDTSAAALAWCVNNGILYMFRLIQHGGFSVPNLVQTAMDDYVKNSIVVYSLPGASIPY